jgi:putative hemolysin
MLAEHPERFLPTVLVANNLFQTAAATLGTLIAIVLIANEGVGAIVAAVAVAAVLIVFAESLPKTLGTRRPYLIAVLSAGPLLFLERVLFAVVYPLQLLNRWVAARAGDSDRDPIATQEELKVLISVNRESGSLDESEASLLLRTLRLTDLRVREVMTPKPEIIYVPDRMTVAQFMDFNSRQFHSRFPVVKGDLDNVVGILEARDVLRVLGAGPMQQSDAVATLMKPAQFVSETDNVIDTITRLRRWDIKLAIVVNEYGGAVGLVTFNHLIGQIAGRSYEVHDTGKDKSPGSRAVLIKGSTRIYEANERLGLGLPHGSYDSVAGFIINEMGRLPQTGQSIVHGEFEFTVASMRGPKVEEVKVVRRSQVADAILPAAEPRQTE